MSMLNLPIEPDATSLRVHLLDMGGRKYGDCILCEYQDTTILIDGGHSKDYYDSADADSIPSQLGSRYLLNGEPPFHVSLLVVTHCHSDHIGCLPKMVEYGKLTADWALVADEKLGWGRHLDDSDGPAFDADAISPGAQALIAALQEDSRADLDDDELMEFLADAGWLEKNYKQMLAKLAADGTRVVRYGRDSTSALEAAFGDIGLKIIGPTREHLRICANVLRQDAQDLARAFGQMPAQDTAEDSLPNTYRRLMGVGSADVLGADRPGPGAARNDQSIVLKLEAAGRKALLPGDMQFAKAEVPGLNSHMRRLRQAVADEGPYDFVKIAHHSSYNGLDESVFQECGARRLGHQSGTGSSHPHTSVLNVLKAHRQDIKFCRSDLNGLCTVRLGHGGIWFYKSRGVLNDFSPPSRDTGAPEEPTQSPTTGTGGEVEVHRREAAGGEFVEVTAKVPHVRTKVTLTIDVEPSRSTRPVATGGLPSAETGRPSTSPRDEPLPDFRLAGGRSLPRLLFVTSRDGLGQAIGARHADHLLRAVAQAGHAVLDGLPAGQSNIAGVAPMVRRRLEEERASRESAVQGVVILGGYDVVPAQRLDTIDLQLRRQVEPLMRDADHFLVWSDEIFGDEDGDGLPELPVSRVPDSHSHQFMYAALQATRPQNPRGRFGVRNVARPFAELVFNGLSGQQDLFVSEPTTYDHIPPEAVDADLSYFMLHGAAYDGTTFWGEAELESPEAVTIDIVPSRYSGVILTGCCWGALCADRPAYHSPPNHRVRGRDAKDSIALSYLAAGAVAFVGCTGTHYSPTTEPYGYFGQPMHDAFWRHYLGGDPPALALFKAKQDYVAGIPYASPRPEYVAIELKILRQFTCLGLGW